MADVPAQNLSTKGCERSLTSGHRRRVFVKASCSYCGVEHEVDTIVGHRRVLKERQGVQWAL